MLDEMTPDGWDQGYTLKAMQVGLWCLHAPLDVEHGLVAMVMQGGDADTNGAVAGSVLGARAGVRAWPERWLDLVPRRASLTELATELIARGT